ncbi:39S ribosomal protein L46, mitochondrial-like isoform X1 [Haliotis rubra]|uniref:39S ribosomal protein L46, mitochondrial-like isoform X1 n=2 Tax=Haliotis rubra TaxID=36100 RepID=UPI001EE531D1|nr:39S ribosomal protein L46, mitochondrial-like isoform X1 [Haliotis rubra]
MAASCSRFAVLRSLFRRNRLQGFHYLKRSASSSQTGKSFQQWQLMSAVCVERFPVITELKTKMEDRFGELLDKMEFENSLLSNHEIRHRNDILREARRKEDDFEETEAEAVTQTALDLEDMWEMETKQFTPADRLTDADKSGDKKSTDRKLTEKLVLLVKQKVGDKPLWVFPQGSWSEGESLRETAERVLGVRCGEELSAQFVGNAPCGVHQYVFRSSPETETGVKLFFFKAAYKTGSVNVDEDSTEDFLWVTKRELRDYLHPSYYSSVKSFILDI